MIKFSEKGTGGGVVKGGCRRGWLSQCLYRSLPHDVMRPNHGLFFATNLFRIFFFISCCYCRVASHSLPLGCFASTGF